MTFVKVLKNKAYFKRYQTKYRRRRLGKTDYYARQRLIKQVKNKYNTPKYRFVVRFTNQYCICQVVYSLKNHDKVICSAYSSELRRYGLPVGLKSYPAAYATGLLCARRLLSKLTVQVDDTPTTLAELYEGETEPDAEVKTTIDEDSRRKYYVSELDRDEDGEVRFRPFRCFLDVGIRRTTKGCRIFGALKGAVDGGLDIPHNEKLFPGYVKEDGQPGEYDADMHRSMIFGVMIGEYMASMQDEDEDKYNQHFAKYIENDINADNIEDKIAAVHAAIRADPSPRYAESARTREYEEDRKTKKPNAARAASIEAHPQQVNRKRLSYDERKARVEAKLQRIADALAGDDEDDE